MPTTTKSITREAIGMISVGPCAALLTPRGFRRKAPNYWRSTEGIFQSVNFQASPWGTQDAGSFTINLGVTSPVLYEAFTGRDLPANPATLLWPVNRRIGSLMPSPHDLWWDVRVDTDTVELGKEVATTLEAYALPFLEKLRTPERLNASVLTERSVTGLTDAQLLLVRATLAAQLGDQGTAVQLLREALDKYSGKPFEATVRQTAAALNLPIHDA
jgi:Domain of unknown function (DUF4304)